MNDKPALRRRGHTAMSNIFEAAVRDEATLRAALADADIAPMLMVLSQLSGDLDILDEVAPHIHGAWIFLETVPEDLKKKVRDRLVAVLKDYATTGNMCRLRHCRS